MLNGKLATENNLLSTLKRVDVVVNHDKDISAALQNDTMADAPVQTEAVHTIKPSSVFKFLINSSHILPISVLTVVLIVILIVTFAVFRYLHGAKGSYHTQEDAADCLATDRDTAVLQSTTGHRVEKRREWIL